MTSCFCFHAQQAPLEKRSSLKLFCLPTAKAYTLKGNGLGANSFLIEQILFFYSICLYKNGSKNTFNRVAPPLPHPLPNPQLNTPIKTTRCHYLYNYAFSTILPLKTFRKVVYICLKKERIPGFIFFKCKNSKIYFPVKELQDIFSWKREVQDLLPSKRKKVQDLFSWKRKEFQDLFSWTKKKTKKNSNIYNSWNNRNSKIYLLKKKKKKKKRFPSLLSWKRRIPGFIFLPKNSRIYCPEKTKIK